MPSRDDIHQFLRRVNSAAYGTSACATVSQQADLDDITTGLATAMTAAARRSPAGQLPASDCPLLYSDEDPRNVWALDGRQRAAVRTVELPFVGVRAIVEQRWRSEPQQADASIAGDDDLEGHSTTGVCWDGAVVLADLLCHPPAVLAAQSPNLARRYRAAGHTHRPWSWAWADKVVVELGCGTSALPSCAAALHGPRAVVCTDGNSRALPIASANTARWAKEHPTSTPVSAAQLRWGEGGEAAMLRSVGLSDAPVDVIIAADVFYVLDNPGGWGKFLATVVALSAPHTLVFITYTDRGHDKLFRKFVERRVEKFFRTARVAPFLLHPVAHPGTPGRLEQITPTVEVLCWARREEAESPL